MNQQGRNEAGKFSAKSDEVRQVRSIRLTDTTWESLGNIANERGITRADLIEHWMNSEYFDLVSKVQELELEIQNLKSNSIQLSELTLQDLDHLANERSITRENLIIELIELTKSSSTKSESSITQTELLDLSTVIVDASQITRLSQTQLAKRWNDYDSSNLAKRRNKGYEKFAAFSASKDPDGIAWRYSESDRFYYPIIDYSK